MVTTTSKVGKFFCAIICPAELITSNSPGISPSPNSLLKLYATEPIPPIFGVTSVRVNNLYPWSFELYPLIVVPTPTVLIFSIITSSPTSNGNEVLNPIAMVTVTSLVTVLNPTVLIPTPLVFFIGNTVGVELLIPLVLLKMVTDESPKEYLVEISVI